MVTAVAKKIDLVKERPEYFHAGIKPELVHLAPALYLTLDGGGAPSQDGGKPTEFQTSIQALYAVAYAVKVRCKKAGRDFKVPALQALWSPYHSFGEGERDLLHIDAASWRWKVMIMMPDFVEEADVAQAKEEKARTTGTTAIDRVRLETIDEGLCVQALHVGPYREEHHAIVALRELMERTHLRPCGLHHEIYLNDPNHTAPDKIRVILRQPVRVIDNTAPCPPDEW